MMVTPNARYYAPVSSLVCSQVVGQVPDKSIGSRRCVKVWKSNLQEASARALSIGSTLEADGTSSSAAWKQKPS